MAVPSSAMEAAALGPEELVCASGRNRKAVLCQRCGSRVLLPGAATFTRRELFLPAMKKKTALVTNGDLEGDVLQDHWLVEDMFSFENKPRGTYVPNFKFVGFMVLEIS
uniref:Uncharacterized protein n=1 Tax=Naja naja TaxID=35670 RepID=A0A8C6YA54_NAJNA